MNPMMIFGRVNFAQPEEWPSIWARIQVFLCPAFTPEAELHNAASPTWFASSVSVTKHSSNYIKRLQNVYYFIPQTKKKN